MALVLTQLAQADLISEMRYFLVISTLFFNSLTLSAESKIEHGYEAIAEYPIEVTGLKPPYKTLKRVLEEESDNPLRFWLEKLFKKQIPWKNLGEFYDWVGLHPFPENYPFPKGKTKMSHLGAGLLPTRNGPALTLSCATCHSSQLFGKTIVGLSNRFPRAQEVFYQAKFISKNLTPSLFRLSTGASSSEVRMYSEVREKLKFIDTKKPIALGLDTSLAHVALSLSHRSPDSVATLDKRYARKPRPTRLRNFRADSKPLVWWNTKYKSRWLSDGSIIAKEPITTNLLWNAIGRATDLNELENWLLENQEKVEALKAAVYSTEAPRITDFYSADLFEIEELRKGQQVFNQRCSKCHGEYLKNWDRDSSLPWAEQLKTYEVLYDKNKKAKDVGTDPQRYQGMQALAPELNRLRISQTFGIEAVPQKGYLPPPLVGIWARWPYFHNNSVPNLCALLTPGPKRPKQYYAGPAENKERDFDLDCNGYPLAEKTPKEWKKSEFLYDTHRPGLSNLGHDQRIFIRDGKLLISLEERQALIRFLQTL